MEKNVRYPQAQSFVFGKVHGSLRMFEPRVLGRDVGQVIGTAKHLDDLNPAQRWAVGYDIDGSRRVPGPLLILAGAGSGKTRVLAHRVAHLILNGADPERILLLTFTRRAAREMIRRVRRILSAVRVEAQGAVDGPARITWAGTFHSIANRLLRLYSPHVGLPDSFTVLDRTDAEDLLDLVRHDMGLSQLRARFPRKATCLAIYSHSVNAACPLDRTLARHFPWCAQWEAELRALFRAYVAAKQQRHVVDYDDLLLYWRAMLREPAVATLVRDRFDHVLVDEYQDTNVLQAEILLALKPNGEGLTVVGDDAQSIYSFRSATVRNILDFPRLFDPPAFVVTLEQNYRSTQSILAACNAVIGLSTECSPKRLFSDRLSRQRPLLVTAEDESGQVEYVVASILENREAGIELKRQAVLFRASHHSARLEMELTRRGIPFVKYGGLRFLEVAHVKDLVCVLRWAENPHDELAAFRVLRLLPGIGPGGARRAFAVFRDRQLDFHALREVRVSPAVEADWIALCNVLQELSENTIPLSAQVGLARAWYQPHLERLYESPLPRAADLDQLEALAAEYPSRERFLTELALEPAEASGDYAREPHVDEEYLVLSTIHSAKGQEWDVVYVLNVVDGCIPADLAAATAEQIEEERRVLYVAMTRARNQLHMVHPLRFFVRQQRRYGDRHVYAPRSRFLPESILHLFERRVQGRYDDVDAVSPGKESPCIDLAAQVRAMWDDDRKPSLPARKSALFADR